MITGTDNTTTQSFEDRTVEQNYIDKKKSFPVPCSREGFVLYVVSESAL